jgi:transcriptional regulator GlxA family with amidase domain
MKRLLFVLFSLALAGTAAAKTRNVAIVLYDGVELLDFAGPAEVFTDASRNAADDGTPAFKVYTVSANGGTVKSQGFLNVNADYSITSAPKPDLLVIPGGNSANLYDNEAMRKWLRDSATASEITLTVCTGAFPLAKEGLFDGLEITTFYNATDALQKAAPNTKVTPGRRFVDNGKYITTAGVSAGIDGALHVVARLLGRRVADLAAQNMEYRWTPETYLEKQYAYLNPSTDDRGRALQAAAMARDEKRYDDAAAKLRALTAADANDEAAWLQLGTTYLLAKQYDEAIAAYSHVGTSSKPLHIYALYNTACAYAGKGDRANAMSAIQAAFDAGASRAAAKTDDDLMLIRSALK